MKIFITGASGFIGSHLADRLATEGHEVRALIRHTQDKEVFEGRGIKIIQGDLDNRQILSAGMEGCDVVFHLAAYAKPSSHDPYLPYRTNVEGTINILEASKENKIKRIVVTSTAGISGFSKDGLTVNEITAGPSTYFTEYERTKAIAEKIAIESSSEDMEVIVVSPTRVFGPGRLSESNSVTRIIDLYGKGLWRIIPGNGESYGNYVFVDDVVNGHILAALKGRAGEKYILGGENLSYMEFFDSIGKAYGVKRRMLKISASNLRRITGIIISAAKLSGKQPLITREWTERYLQNWIFSSQKAMDRLEYTITPFEEGVKRTIEWLRSDNVK